MVSYMPNLIIFYLSYRYLRKLFRFKRGASLLPVPRSKGLRIAQEVETDNAAPRRCNYVYNHKDCIALTIQYSIGCTEYIPRGVTLLCF